MSWSLAGKVVGFGWLGCFAVWLLLGVIILKADPAKSWLFAILFQITMAPFVALAWLATGVFAAYAGLVFVERALMPAKPHAPQSLSPEKTEAERRVDRAKFAAMRMRLSSRLAILTPVQFGGGDEYSLRLDDNADPIRLALMENASLKAELRFSISDGFLVAREIVYDTASGATRWDSADRTSMSSTNDETMAQLAASFVQRNNY